VRELAAAGEIYIQDEASQLVGQILEIQPGHRVLDVCAAPGSKATQIAPANSATVIAGDVHEHRLRTVAEAVRLQKIPSIQCVVLDGRQVLPFAPGSFERVLLDAPCSGTGTLRHNPEIRWRISAQDIRDLPARQKLMLSNASRVVKPGGRLVYSTCSVEREENEQVVGSFLENDERFVQVDLTVKYASIAASGAVRTWPQRDDVDGFFIAAFEYRSG
jgi:16S rRNA (cytosine967-C5)-methyltransferase